VKKKIFKYWNVFKVDLYAIWPYIATY